jgi:hypothetical protein
MSNQNKILAEEIQIGNNDLRASCDMAGGFAHVVLRDADDGDLIVINEDDIVPLMQYLNRVLEEARSKGVME